MHFPIDIHFGSFIIQSHPLFEFLAIILAYKFYMYLRMSKKITPLPSYINARIIFGAVIGAFIGSRLIAALEHPDLFLNPPVWFYYFGGQTVAGGIGGGIIGVEIAKWYSNVKQRTGDIFVYPLILGICIGRIGCFLTGVRDGTVGSASNLPWAIDQGDGIPRHPTSVYEIIFLLITWFVLKKIEYKKIFKEGDLFSLFVVGYFVFRFCIEFIKPRETVFYNVSAIQIISAAIVFYYIVYFIKSYIIHTYDK